VVACLAAFAGENSVVESGNLVPANRTRAANKKTNKYNILKKNKKEQ
jgi:hypothetical protein